MTRLRPFVVVLLLAAVGWLVSVPASNATGATPHTRLTASLSLSTSASTIGQRVTASVSSSTLPGGDTLKTAALTWGDHTKAVELASLASKASHRYARPGRYTASLALTDRKGHTAHATATITVRSPAGSFSGGTSQNRPLTFFVDLTGRTLQDISFPTVQLTCTPGGATEYDQMAIAATPISARGAFSSSTSQHGVFLGEPAVFTYQLRGTVAGVSPTGAAAAAGTFRETLTYSDTAKRTCTSNNQTWTATRDVQPTQTNLAPPAGSYTGPTSQNRSASFFVSNDRKTLQDVTIPTVQLDCSPGGATQYDQLSIPSIRVTSTRAFSATASQTGVFLGEMAKFTYSFRGNFHSVSAAGTPRATGTFRETVTYTDTAPRTCTSDDQTWSTTRDLQPAQTTAAPPAGSYTGSTSQNRSLTFFVSANQKSLQDIAIPTVQLDCSPGGATQYDRLSIASAPIAVDGSFSASTTQAGVYLGQVATFAYSFRGNFHSVDNNGTPRAAGTFRETVTYTDTTARACTSDNQVWSIARDSQPAQTAGAPPAGTYTGSTSQNRSVSFDVATGGGSLTDISIPVVQLQCTPGGTSPYDLLSITSATVNADGSFTATATQTGVFDAQTADFTYSFRGNFHSVDANGTPRAAGTFRETVTYTDTAARTCTSDDQMWSAKLTAAG